MKSYLKVLISQQNDEKTNVNLKIEELKISAEDCRSKNSTLFCKRFFVIWMEEHEETFINSV